MRPANLMPTCPHARCGQQIGASEAAGAGLMKCARCRKVLYCSRACQKAAWKGGHKQECEELAQGSESLSLRQEALLAAFRKMTAAFHAKNFRQVVDMAEEGLAAAAELTRSEPGVGIKITSAGTTCAAFIYYMLGHSYSDRFEYVQGLELLIAATGLPRSRARGVVSRFGPTRRACMYVPSLSMQLHA